MRILATFVGGWGHAEPLLAVAQIAAGRGHAVTFAGQSAIVPRLAELGFDTVAVGPATVGPDRRPLVPVDRDHERRVIRDHFAGTIADSGPLARRAVRLAARFGRCDGLRRRQSRPNASSSPVARVVRAAGPSPADFFADRSPLYISTAAALIRLRARGDLLLAPCRSASATRAFRSHIRHTSSARRSSTRSRAPIAPTSAHPINRHSSTSPLARSSTSSPVTCSPVSSSLSVTSTPRLSCPSARTFHPTSSVRFPTTSASSSSWSCRRLPPCCAVVCPVDPANYPSRHWSCTRRAADGCRPARNAERCRTRWASALIRRRSSC